MPASEVLLGGRQEETRRRGQPEVGEVDLLAVGAHVAEVAVHVQQVAAPQERHDPRQLPLDRVGLPHPVAFVQPVIERIRDVLAEQHEAVCRGGQRLEAGTHGWMTAQRGHRRVDDDELVRDGGRPRSTRQWWSSENDVVSPARIPRVTITFAASSRHALNPGLPIPYWQNSGRSNRFAVPRGLASSRSVSGTRLANTGWPSTSTTTEPPPTPRQPPDRCPPARRARHRAA